MKLLQSTKARAFTLLEIMVALTILAIVIFAIYSSWMAIVKGSQAALRAAATAQRERIAMSTVQDSLLSACMFTQNARYYGFLVSSEGDFSSLSFVARLPRSFLRSGKYSDLVVRRLSFTVESGQDAKKQLVLRQNPLLLDADKDETDNPVILAQDVTLFKVECLDPKTGDWDTDWTDASTNQLPQVVRVTLGVGHQDQFSSKPQEADFCVVNLPAQAVRREWEMPTPGPGGQPPPPGPGGINTGKPGQLTPPGAVTPLK